MNKWKRLSYFLIGAILGPIFLGLGLFVLFLAARGPCGQGKLVGYAIAAFLFFIAIVVGSAVRATFRDPPWWIVTPERTRQSDALLIKRQIMKISEKRLRRSEKDAERILKLTKLEKLEGSGPQDPANGL